jgi:hypothetical protein
MVRTHFVRLLALDETVHEAADLSSLRLVIHTGAILACSTPPVSACLIAIWANDSSPWSCPMARPSHPAQTSGTPWGRSTDVLARIIHELFRKLGFQCE